MTLLCEIIWQWININLVCSFRHKINWLAAIMKQTFIKLNDNWSTDNAFTGLTVPFFTSLVWRGSGNGLAQGPHYDRFSQNSSTWSSDHWYCALTNSATVATRGTGDWFSGEYMEGVYRMGMHTVRVGVRWKLWVYWIGGGAETCRECRGRQYLGK